MIFVSTVMIHMYIGEWPSCKICRTSRTLQRSTYPSQLERLRIFLCDSAKASLCLRMNALLPLLSQVMCLFSTGKGLISYCNRVSSGFLWLDILEQWFSINNLIRREDGRGQPRDWWIKVYYSTAHAAGLGLRMKTLVARLWGCQRTMVLSSGEKRFTFVCLRFNAML